MVLKVKSFRSCVFGVLMLLFFIQKCYTLRIVNLSVPALKPRGETATLICEFDLEGEKLYAVRWYRNGEEFYRYMPRMRPPQHSHILNGVNVDLAKSSARRVHLRELTLQSRGQYRCEVSEEAPTFDSVEAESPMEVFYFPREAPVITGHDSPYNLDGNLEVNCTSAKSFPAPELQWHVNGQKVVSNMMLIHYKPEPAGQDLYTRTLGLRMPAKPKLRLRCSASIGTHRREKTVYIEINACKKAQELDIIIFFCIIINIRLLY